jgi:hypothetical protein
VLSEKGKIITGQTVVPVACDNLTREFLAEFGEQIDQADVLLIMTCAFGVFDEICTQCGTCIIGETGGICPVTNCHKGLVNGPCGGTNHGKCEIDIDKDCVWTLIYNRLKELDRLDAMRKYQKPRNH